jgi:hypothetical protein
VEAFEALAAESSHIAFKYEAEGLMTEGATTISGPEPEYSFIRSVDLSELARLVKTRGG